MKKVLKNFLGRVFLPRGLRLDDQVTWNLHYVEAAVWAKQFGEGPFFVSSVEAEEGLLTLSDEKGVHLKGQYETPQGFPEKLLRKI